jgi:hypothetical protein
MHDDTFRSTRAKPSRSMPEFVFRGSLLYLIGILQISHVRDASKSQIGAPTSYGYLWHKEIARGQETCQLRTFKSCNASVSVSRVVWRTGARGLPPRRFREWLEAYRVWSCARFSLTGVQGKE